MVVERRAPHPATLRPERFQRRVAGRFAVLAHGARRVSLRVLVAVGRRNEVDELGAGRSYRRVAARHDERPRGLRVRRCGHQPSPRPDRAAVRGDRFHLQSGRAISSPELVDDAPRRAVRGPGSQVRDGDRRQPAPRGRPGRRPSDPLLQVRGAGGAGHRGRMAPHVRDTRRHVGQVRRRGAGGCDHRPAPGGLAPGVRQPPDRRRMRRDRRPRESAGGVNRSQASATAGSLYAAGGESSTPRTRGRAAIQSVTSDSSQRTARGPTATGRGNADSPIQR